jgi:mono/diheme cytochrome c family protein
MLKPLLVTTMGTMLAMGMAYAGQNNSKVTIPVNSTPATSGKQMYTSYCAPCHGADGRGEGPVAQVLKTPPTDLTELARNNRGKFPDTHIIEVLENGTTLQAHGTAQMPVWGPIFAKMNTTNPQERMLRVSNLSRYLETLQVK